MSIVHELVPPFTLPIPTDADICNGTADPGWTKDDPPVEPDGGPDDDPNAGRGSDQ